MLNIIDSIGLFIFMKFIPVITIIAGIIIFIIAIFNLLITITYTILLLIDNKNTLKHRWNLFKYDFGPDLYVYTFVAIAGAVIIRFAYVILR